MIHSSATDVKTSVRKIDFEVSSQNMSNASEAISSGDVKSLKYNIALIVETGIKNI
jgi:hypothetical protein